MSKHPPCPKCGESKLRSAGRTEKNAGSLRCSGCGKYTSRKALALNGWSPDHDMTRTVPEGFTVRGVSTLYREDGSIGAQWVKSKQDPERVRRMLEAAAEAFSAPLPRLPAVPPPAHVAADLLNQYTITDYHLGMLAWGEESGADWDLKIAEDLVVRWFEVAIERAPAADTAVFAQLGDWGHWDGLEPLTPASKHVLDADTRFEKLVAASIRIHRRIVDMLLGKHRRVIVLIKEGNHDPASSVWLRQAFAAIYENEPRVEVETRPDPYSCVEFGAVALFYHHGHKRGMRKGLSSVFAAKFREVFGRTRFAYGHTGHYHHDHVIEDPLMHLEQHETLAAPDAYASRGGYMSNRSAKVITYHRAHGEVGRLTISPDMVRAA